MNEQTLFEKLLKEISSYLGDEEISLVKRAYEFAKKAHGEQARESGDKYIIHPLHVALILAEMRLDAESYAAALLHDVVEDTSVTLDKIKKEFGENIAFLVDGVTKLEYMDHFSSEETKLENLRKMLLSMASDVRVVIIKLADRLHNMRTLFFLPPDRQKQIAMDTMDIYVPLAHRLGIYKVKWELEDLSFRYLKQDEYYELAKKVSSKRDEREKFVSDIVKEIKDLLNGQSIKAEISGRPKNLYSIYRKMMREEKEFNEIYDLVAVRIIVLSVPECYQVLGILHNSYKPIPGRVKDYIAMPKPNGYRSLHTTVITKSGEPLEVQIRTREMHKHDEIGIAAHWKYKEGIQLDKNYESKLMWLRQIVDWQKEVRSTKEFVEMVKGDLFSEEVLVFTPKGDVIDLPVGATPIDFAYRVHTDIGNYCVGAKINGAIVPLPTELKTGDRVEILTSKSSIGPKLDWLQFVRTSSARSKIRYWLRKLRETPEEKSEKKEEQQEKKEVKRSYVRRATPRIFQKEETVYYPAVPGVKGIKISIARCCNPEPQDPIIGYVTRGRGIKIHKKDCPNLVAIISSGGKVLPAVWEAKGKAKFLVYFRITVWNVPGIIYRISRVTSEMNVNIENFRTSNRTEKRKHGYYQSYLRFSFVAEKHSLITDIAREIKLIPEVITVRWGKRRIYEDSSSESEESVS
ncbi:MAG: bifunctional (p)ppGpp synthetase/guanosine-3',5'-bis(diphosphate) 3'-pyrophosphohydrolase [Caldiserica bacterium]|nr:MAG: bifunctional (p)ppGpp synthetase/guanosine-3',5'-bis(diphosphate) 3'-pyrophosphohydrolase [Caldisericota bacterium]